MADPIPVPPLLAVVLVFRSKPEFAGLPDFIILTSLYLDSSVLLTLADACKRNSTKLLDRIWQFSQVYVNGTADPTTPWSIHQFTRNEKWYRQFQFRQALKAAIRLDNFAMFRWLSDNFQGHLVTCDVVNEAAKMGAFQVLNFLMENGENSIAFTQEAIPPTYRVRRQVEWSGDCCVEAAKAGRSDVVLWLFENVRETCLNYWDDTFMKTVAAGDLALGQRLLGIKRMYLPLIDRQLLALDVVEQGRLDVLQFLSRQQLLAGTVGLVVKAAEKGYLDVVRWLIKQKSVVTQYDPRHVDEHNGLPDFKAEAALSIHFACINGHVDVAKYLHEQPIAPTRNEQRVVEEFARLNKWLQRMLGPVHSRPTRVSAKTMTGAVKNGHVQVVKWLYDEYQSGIDLFGYNYAEGAADTVAMDVAAECGHLALLQYLHELQISIDLTTKKRRREDNKRRKRPRPECTLAAMDSAAANGHLEVV